MLRKTQFVAEVRMNPQIVVCPLGFILWESETVAANRVAAINPPIDDTDPIWKFSIDPGSPTDLQNPAELSPKGKPIRNFSIDPTSSIRTRLRTPFLRTPFPRLLYPLYRGPNQSMMHISDDPFSAQALVGCWLLCLLNLIGHPSSLSLRTFLRNEAVYAYELRLFLLWSLLMSPINCFQSRVWHVVLAIFLTFMASTVVLVALVMVDVVLKVLMV